MFLHTRLDFFTAEDNDFTGQVLPYFEGRNELQILAVGENIFTGSIPTFFGQFTDLEVLSLLGNDFTGTIPSELGNLSNLSKYNVIVLELLFQILWPCHISREFLQH